MEKYLEEIYQGYIEALFFSEANIDGELNNLDVSDLADETILKIKEWIAEFWKNAELVYFASDYTTGQMGHDLFFTQFRHGVGFWEEDYCTPEQSTILTKFAHKLPENGFYQGTDGKIYC